MGPGDLQDVLGGLKQHEHADLLVGLSRSDDAAVYRITDEIAIVSTVDFFPPIVDDPYLYGAIAAANSMSDVYAMGGQVLFALNVAGFPREMPKDVIAAVFKGGADKVLEAGGVVAGGHTVVDAEPKYGLAVTGRVHPKRILIKGGLRPGHRLFLSKPLGTGVIATAAKDDACDARRARGRGAEHAASEPRGRRRGAGGRGARRDGYHGLRSPRPRRRDGRGLGGGPGVAPRRTSRSCRERWSSPRRDRSAEG